MLSYTACRSLIEDFRKKVQHDFSRYIYVGLSWGNFSQERVIKTITSQEGYESHKIVYYGMLWSHIYVKFEDGNLALKAAVAVKNLGRNFSAEIVKNLLCTLYIKEMEQPSCGTWAVIESQGMEQSHRQPLLRRTLQCILREFGSPQIFPPSTGNPFSTRLAFSSMAEALGATIAFGLWYKRFDTCTGNFYKIMMIGRRKEAELLTKIGFAQGINFQAFKLDYFWNPDADDFWNCLNQQCNYHRQREIPNISRIPFQYPFQERNFSAATLSQPQDATAEYERWNCIGSQNYNPSNSKSEHLSFLDEMNFRPIHYIGDAIAQEHNHQGFTSTVSDTPVLDIAHKIAHLSHNSAMPLNERIVEDQIPESQIVDTRSINTEPTNFQCTEEYPSAQQNHLRVVEYSNDDRIAQQTNTLPLTSMPSTRHSQNGLSSNIPSVRYYYRSRMDRNRRNRNTRMQSGTRNLCSFPIREKEVPLE